MRDLGELESAVMDHVWAIQEPTSVREVLATLGRPLAYTTVMTVMDNLHRKGFLERDKEGRAYLYWPARSRAEHTAALMSELLAASGDRGATILAFLGRMTPQDAAEISRAVATDDGPHV